MNLTLIAAAIAATLSFGTAWTVQDWRYGAQEAERIAAETEARDAQGAQANTAATGHEVDKVRLQTKFVTVTETVEKIIEKPTYRADCFDADGLRTHADAIKLTGNTSEPSYPLPSASAPR